MGGRWDDPKVSSYQEGEAALGAMRLARRVPPLPRGALTWERALTGPASLSGLADRDAFFFFCLWLTRFLLFDHS